MTDNPHEWFVQLQATNRRYDQLERRIVPDENHPLVDYLMVAVGACLKLAGESAEQLREGTNLSDMLPTANNLLHLVKTSSQDHDKLIKALEIEIQPFGRRDP